MVWKNFLMRKSNKKKKILAWRQIFSVKPQSEIWFCGSDRRKWNLGQNESDICVVWEENQRIRPEKGKAFTSFSRIHQVPLAFSAPKRYNLNHSSYFTETGKCRTLEVQNGKTKYI